MKRYCKGCAVLLRRIDELEGALQRAQTQPLQQKTYALLNLVSFANRMAENGRASPITNCVIKRSPS